MLILVAVALLTGFVVVMGGINFQPTFTTYVGFDNPGGLQPGAPVKIAGVKVGKIAEIQFRGDAAEADAKSRMPLVRVKALIERRYQKSIHDDCVVYVTTQGVLGEQFMAIDPGSSQHPTIGDDAVIRGLDPPRLDMLLAEGYELLHTSIAALRENKKQLSETFDGLHATLRGAGDFFHNNGERLQRIAENTEKITVDVDGLVGAAQKKYVDNPRIDQIIGRVDDMTAKIDRDVDPMLKDARTALAAASRVASAVGSPEDAARLHTMLGDVADIASTGKAATADAQVIVSHIRKGKGSVGALVMDEQVYDDVQELLRDLKHNPWKLFWRE